ncbi:fatty acid-2 hydroxylase [Cylindrobasidium torrendii FP15055 ss-10]|uniref:Ceramide very long chain fatty acid hydroxylase n=1 Tax=Cylindrobasidium torrendii FP15055 ss-10 TaxID=1314674 RepID=A0A0D7BML6_9AGAR|nr:fatty acid-2 hydroxylase [Cylindrobasidium torrendii FP15055 ss-10]
MSKRNVKIVTHDEVAKHDTVMSCWLSFQDRVYDVTNFLADHPGGDDIMLKYAGKNVDTVMADPEEHEHSESAYEMMSEFLIARIGGEEHTCSEDWVASDDYHPDDTNEELDFQKNQFLDLRKPLLMQVWRGNFSKAFYLKQIHQPRHVPESPRLFGPDWMEMLTRTTWYVVPIFWAPIAAYIFLRALFQFTAPIPNFWQNPVLPLHAILSITPEAIVKTILCFLTGNVIWTILEYVMHRFLFHLDDYLPDNGTALTIHFLLHGVHHYIPMDRLRLVMPPTLFTALQYPFTQLAYKLFPTPVANGIISGAFTFYIFYDCVHYHLHHTNLGPWMRELKRYHLGHHYKNYELAFGVTSKFWDRVFGTVLIV